jgi:hypothetical protein
MVVVSERDGRRRLEPYLATLCKAITSGDRLFQERYASNRSEWKSRSVSSVRNDLIVSEAKRLFDPDPDVRFESRYGREIMYIGDIAVIVFKKLNRRKRTMNIPTQLTLELFKQQPLPFMPDETPRFVAGWQVDSLNIAVQSVFITHPNGRWLEWSFRPDEDEGEQKTIRITPTRTPPALGPAVKTKVQKEAEEDGRARHKPTASS